MSLKQTAVIFTAAFTYSRACVHKGVHSLLGTVQIHVVIKNIISCLYSQAYSPYRNHGNRHAECGKRTFKKWIQFLSQPPKKRQENSTYANLSTLKLPKGSLSEIKQNTAQCGKLGMFWFRFFSQNVQTLPTCYFFFLIASLSQPCSFVLASQRVNINFLVFIKPRLCQPAQGQRLAVFSEHEIPDNRLRWTPTPTSPFCLEHHQLKEASDPAPKTSFFHVTLNPSLLPKAQRQREGERSDQLDRDVQDCTGKTSLRNADFVGTKLKPDLGLFLLRVHLRPGTIPVILNISFLLAKAQRTHS